MSMFNFLKDLKEKMDTSDVTNLAKECTDANKDAYICTFLRGTGMVEKGPNKAYEWKDGEVTPETAEYVRYWTNYVKNG